MRFIENKVRSPKYYITHKPIERATCGAAVTSTTSRLISTDGKCRGVLMRQTLSRIEEGLGHEGFACDACGRRIKYVPPREK